MELFVGAIGVLIVLYAFAKMLRLDGILRAIFRVKIGFKLWRLTVLLLFVALGVGLYQEYISPHIT